MKRLMTPFIAIATVVLAAVPSFAQNGGSSSASMPRSLSSDIRLSPVAGASSFTTSSKVSLDNFSQGFSAGVLADIGPGYVAFETGVLTLGSQVNRAGGTSSITVNNWGIPLLAKVNFSGKPNETVFLKAGAMPYTTTGDISQTNIMGVAGVGANIPLGMSSAILLDAAYNRLFTNNGDLSNYQGISLLAGLSFSI
jgi:hypothetical protein